MEEYLSKKAASWQADAIRRIAALVGNAAPSATLAIKWGQPVFESNGAFAYVRPAKAHVTLGFWRGAELDDPKGRLEGEGDRMKHVKYKTPDAIDEAEVAAWVRQAVELNARLGSPTARG